MLVDVKMMENGTLIERDFLLMQISDAFHGYGYLGHTYRYGVTDAMLMEAAVELGLGKEQVFAWANSVYGRKFMDAHPEPLMMDFYYELYERKAFIASQVEQGYGEF